MNFSVIPAWGIAGVTMVAILLLAILLANLVNVRPDMSDSKTRKIQFWLLSFCSLFIGLILNYIIYYRDLLIPSQKKDYLLHMLVAGAVSYVVYILLGFILSKIFKSSKLGTWF